MNCGGYKVRIYLCERNRDRRGWGAGLTPRNYHKSVIVSIAITLNPLAQ